MSEISPTPQALANMQMEPTRLAVCGILLGRRAAHLQR
jgi:hypothetical protein